MFPLIITSLQSETGDTYNHGMQVWFGMAGVSMALVLASTILY